MIFWVSYVWPLLWLLALSSVGVPRSLVGLLPTSISFTVLTTNQRNLWGHHKKPDFIFSDPNITMPIMCRRLKLEISPRGFAWIDGPSNAKRSWPIFMNITEFKWLYLCTKNLKRRLFWILHPPSHINVIKEMFFWLFAKLVYDGTNFDELNIWYMAKLI